MTNSLRVVTRIDDLIGQTPIVSLQMAKSSAKVYIKLEKFNPGQSMKDRMALGMINDAEKRGVLKAGGTIVESSSGNTATGLAMIAASRGYRFIAVVDHHASPEKINIISAYGAEIVQVGDEAGEGKVSVVEREKTALELSQKIPGAVFMQQADNLANRESYVHTMASELLNQVGSVDTIFGCIGTGGSLSGLAMGVKAKRKGQKITAVEPVGSILFQGKPGPYYQSGTGNPEGADIPENIRYDLIDNNEFASDDEAFTTCRFLAERLGILVGGSAGGAIYKAIMHAHAQNVDTAVIAPDGGEKYLSTIFSKGWMESRDLFSAKIYASLKRTVRCH